MIVAMRLPSLASLSSRVSIGLAGVFVAGTPVLAQTPSKVPPDESVTLQWVIALGVMVVIGISAFLNPKRSHLN